jgi:hypothetical protein
VWRITANITEGWAGSIDQTSPAALIGTDDLGWALQKWHSNRSTASPQHCGGVCDGTVVAAGIEVNCSSSTLEFDLMELQTVNTSLFNISFQRSLDSNGIPVLEMTQVSMNRVDEHCKGTIGTTTCSIRTAVVEYDLHRDGLFLWLAYGWVPETVVSISILWRSSRARWDTCWSACCARIFWLLLPPV